MFQTNHPKQTQWWYNDTHVVAYHQTWTGFALPYNIHVLAYELLDGGFQSLCYNQSLSNECYPSLTRFTRTGHALWSWYTIIVVIIRWLFLLIGNYGDRYAYLIQQNCCDMYTWPLKWLIRNLTQNKIQFDAGLILRSLHFRNKAQMWSVVIKTIGIPRVCVGQMKIFPQMSMSTRPYIKNDI